MPLLSVKKLTSVSVNAVEIELTVPKNLRKNYRFSPGEYVTIKVDIKERTYMRCYSISKLSDEESLFICVKKVPNGIVSNYMFSDLQESDTMEVGYPEGDFNLRANRFNRKRNIVFVTGGSGITPILPMLQTLYNQNHQGKIVLIYGSLNNEAIIYRKLLSEYKHKFKIINVLENISEKDQNDIKGILTSDLIKSLISELQIDLTSTLFYFTGPPAVVANAETAIVELGVKKSNSYSEKFFIENKKYSDGKDRVIRVRTGKKFKALLLSGYSSVLDACIESNEKVDYKCRVGQCKKCSCKLLRGKVNFNGQIVENKGTILACQAFPMDENIIVDFRKSWLVKFFTNRNYLLLFIFSSFVCLIMFFRSMDDGLAYIAKGEPNTGHEILSCGECHKNEKGSIRQQVQSNWSHYLGGESGALYFGKLPVTSAECIACHERDNDRHDIHRFNEPKYEVPRAKIHPENCISCHAEHKGKRVTIKNTGFCINCHQELSIKNDPVNPSHEKIVALNQWETCLQCHDYHGNHLVAPPNDIGDTISMNRIHDYFEGGKDPYSSKKKYKAVYK